MSVFHSLYVQSAARRSRCLNIDVYSCVETQAPRVRILCSVYIPVCILQLARPKLVPIVHSFPQSRENRVETYRLRVTRLFECPLCISVYILQQAKPKFVAIAHSCRIQPAHATCFVGRRRLDHRIRNSMMEMARVHAKQALVAEGKLFDTGFFTYVHVCCDSLALTSKLGLLCTKRERQYLRLHVGYIRLFEQRNSEWCASVVHPSS